MSPAVAAAAAAAAGSVLLNPSRHRKGLGFAVSEADKALWDAVRSRDIQAVQKLAQQHRGVATTCGHPLDVNAKDDQNDSVLHYSVAEGCVELTAALAALPGVNFSARNAKGRTPLHLAALQAHASPNHLQCLFLLVELAGRDLVALADDDGATALHLAAAHGAERTVTILANEMRTHGYDIEVADHDGQTALQLGARHGSLAVLMALLAAGVSVHRVDFDGSTALAHASACGHLDIVEALLAADADPAASDLHSVSPLKLAVAHGHLHVASLLVHAQESVDLSAIGVSTCEWLAGLCSHALTAMSLNLSANSITDTAAAGMWAAVAVSMTRLVVLDLSRNSLVDVGLGGYGKEGSYNDLPVAVLQGMSRLSSLSMASNAIRSLGDHFAWLSGLVSLDVSENEITHFGRGLAACQRLQRLSARQNALCSLDDSICMLSQLVVLDVSHNALTHLPSNLSSLGQLQSLNASHNRLTSLPRVATSLLSLSLESNGLSDVPAQLGDAVGLEVLGLADNVVENLPPTLARTALRLSRGLSVRGNPLSCLPLQVRDSADGILGFLEDVSEGLEQVLFIRVMVMGDEGAGKTSLVRCLHDPDLSFKALLRQARLPETGGSTLGVEAAKEDTQCFALGAKVSMQFWDLAGQACYLVGHSLLMSDRVLPLYVFDASQPCQRSIDTALKWLDTLMLALPPVTASATRDSLSQRTCRSPVKVTTAASGIASERQAQNDSGAIPARQSLEHSDCITDQAMTEEASLEHTPQHPSFAAHRVAKGGETRAGMESWVVSVVIVCTKVESGSCEREEAIAIMHDVARAMTQRAKQLHGRQLVVRALMGVSNATRECFDARLAMASGKTAVEMNFKQVLQRIAEAGLGVLYTDRQYPRALVPVAYTKLRAALAEYGKKPVLDLEVVSSLAQQHAGITKDDKLHRALSMLQCWGVLVHFRDAPALESMVFQARWCSSLIYTLFMCAHWAAAKSRLTGSHHATAASVTTLNEMQASLATKIDLERLAASDPGGSLLLRGIVTSGAADAMFAGLAHAASLKSTYLCVALLEHVRILYRVQDDSFVVPSLFQHSLPPQIRSVIRGGVVKDLVVGPTCGARSAGRKTLKWSTCREYRFNNLPYKLAAALTVCVCSAADLRSGACSVVTWAEGVWLLAADGSAVLIDSLQARQTISIKTIEVLAHSSPGVGAEGTNSVRWVSKMQRELEILLARFPGVTVEAWIQCPQHGCCEFLPFQRLLGGDRGRSWQNMTPVWDMWAMDDGPGAGGCSQMASTAMCGRVPDSHSYPISIWVWGSVAKQRVDARPGSRVSAVSASDTGMPQGCRSEMKGEGIESALWAGDNDAGTDRVEALQLIQQVDNALTHEDIHSMTTWEEEAIDLAKEGAGSATAVAEYMHDPVNPKQLHLQDTFVLEVVTVCCGGQTAGEIEAINQSIGEVLHEIEEWAPVCKAVFGLIGACLVASGRGKANANERLKFYERMVGLAQTLMQVRDTFCHSPPPQMEGLLRTLKRAAVWIEVFDGRNWFMRSLKSAADKEAMHAFNDEITAHCADMMVSLQSTAYRDGHLMLRDMGNALMSEMHQIHHLAAVHAKREGGTEIAGQQAGLGQGRILSPAPPDCSGTEERLRDIKQEMEDKLHALTQEQAAQTKVLMQQQAEQTKMLMELMRAHRAALAPADSVDTSSPEGLDGDAAAEVTGEAASSRGKSLKLPRSLSRSAEPMSPPPAICSADPAASHSVE